MFRRFQRPIIKDHSSLNKEIKQWLLHQKCPFALMQHFNRSIPKARTLLNTCGLIVAHAANNSLLHIFRWLRKNLNVKKKVCHEATKSTCLQWMVILNLWGLSHDICEYWCTHTHTRARARAPRTHVRPMPFLDRIYIYILYLLYIWLFLLLKLIILMYY